MGTAPMELDGGGGGGYLIVHFIIQNLRETKIFDKFMDKMFYFIFVTYICNDCFLLIINILECVL